VKRDNESNIRQITDRGKLAALLVYVFQSIELAANQKWSIVEDLGGGYTITTTRDSVVHAVDLTKK
jgi:hypothetical protein